MWDFKTIVAIGALYAISALQIWGHDMVDLIQQNDSSGFYYFFSTIAQTLAGAIGFMAAFIALRYQSLVNELGFNGGEIVRGLLLLEPRETNLSERAGHLNRNEMYDELLAAVRHITWDFPDFEKAPNMCEVIPRLRVLSAWKKSFLGQFFGIVGFTVMLIIASVCLLPLVSKSYQTEWMRMTAIVMFILLSVYFFWYVRVIALAIRMPHHPQTTGSNGT